MKRIICSIILVICTCVLFGCGEKNYDGNISALRTDILMGDYLGKKLVVYPEIKEYPFINDGKVGSKRNFVTIKLMDETAENLSVEFLLGDISYGGELTFQVVSNSLLVTLEVDDLPKDKLTVNVKCGEEITAVETKSAKNKDTVNYSTAISQVVKNKGDFIKSVSSGGKINAEIYARLLCDNDKNFWYVGFASGNNKLSSFLIDGKTGEILAEKLSKK